MPDEPREGLPETHSQKARPGTEQPGISVPRLTWCCLIPECLLCEGPRGRSNLEGRGTDSGALLSRLLSKSRGEGEVEQQIEAPSRRKY